MSCSRNSWIFHPPLLSTAQWPPKDRSRTSKDFREGDHDLYYRWFPDAQGRQIFRGASNRHRHFSSSMLSCRFQDSMGTEETLGRGSVQLPSAEIVKPCMFSSHDRARCKHGHWATIRLLHCRVWSLYSLQPWCRRLIC